MYCALGKHPGCRAGHAKGTFCGGVFVPTEAPSRYTDAPHLQRDPVEVTARFSTVTGDPDAHDGRGKPRGLAVRFALPGDSHTDLIAVSLPCFTNRDPADFVTMNRECFRLKDGKSSPRYLGLLRFVRDHPESRRAMLATALTRPVPSYANCRFNSLNAFTWTKGGNPQCMVRYSWRPEAGRRSLTKRAARALPPDFLARDLYERLGRRPARPIRFWLEVQLASWEDFEEGRIDDPTRPWPRKPERAVPYRQDSMRARCITAGVLELTHLVEGPARGKEANGFDPLRLPPGIAPSGDPILAFRPEVYALAAQERVTG